jgi:UDP-3-O-[3-hydroxymyristoyl] glucosamine N-acyltransferase
MIAGASGISGHLNICDDVMIMAMSMVTSDIHQPGQYASGLPLDTLANWRRNGARFRNLDAIAKRVKALEKLGKDD